MVAPRCASKPSRGAGEEPEDHERAREKRIDDCWNVEENGSLSDSWTGFTRFTLLNETLQKDICGRGRDGQPFKQHHVQITHGLTFGGELGKPLKEERNKNGQSRNQNSNMPEI